MNSAMTLIVSVLVEDCIVLAGDSVSTLTTRAPQETPEPEPIKTFPNMQKIFPFYDNFGIGAWGHGSFNGRSLGFRLRALEDNFTAEGRCFNTVNEVVQAISEKLLHLAFEDEWYDDNPFGFYVAGYTGQSATVAKFQYDEEEGPAISSCDSFGSYAACETSVVDCIKELYRQVVDHGSPPFGQFSLQTAIDYALFLIRTTIEFQKFSSKVATVGGAIDVAVVTRLDGFRWIQRQPITAILQGKEKTYNP